MVQTVTSEEFSRVYSPNVVEMLQQRIPGVITNDVQGNEFATGLRYRGFSASPVQGTPQDRRLYARRAHQREPGDTVN
jgi:iron complex outermembrane receptor protein